MGRWADGQMGSDGRTVGRSDGRTGPRFPFLSVCPTVRLSVWLLLPICPSVHLLAQCPDGSPPPCAGRGAGPAPNSVAVLYFENQSPDTTDAYLADGLTEEVIQTLTGIPRLQVQNRYAVRRFRTRSVNDLADVGRALNVAYVVTGTVRRSGTRLRISAELTRAGTGVQIWGRRYDRGPEDVLDIQEEIARQVATGIVGQLLPGERTALDARPTHDAEAYEHYLRGNFYLTLRGSEPFARAVEEYRSALRRDAEFTRPLGRLAYAYGLALVWGWRVPSVPDDSILVQGLALANQALSRDPRDPEGWLGLGYLRVFSDPLKYAGAREAFQRAVALDPENAEAWHQYGSVIRDLGEDSASAAALQRALDIDPNREISWLELSFLSTIGHRYEESLRLIDHAVAAAPGSAFARGNRAMVLLLAGDTARARSDIEFLRAAGWTGFTPLFLAQITARSHDSQAIGAARSAVIALFDSLPPTLRNEDADDLITIWLPAILAFGERERALRLLESIQPRGRTLWSMLRWPSCDPLRNEPRFQRLVEEAGR